VTRGKAFIKHKDMLSGLGQEQDQGTDNFMYLFFSQAVHILLSLVIIGLGIIFAFNSITFSKTFHLVFLTGYPFWGALIVSTIY
jgi:hypothetical protein